MGCHIEGDCTHEAYLMRARRASLAQENVGMVIKILPLANGTFQLQETGLFVARISYL